MLVSITLTLADSPWTYVALSVRAVNARFGPAAPLMTKIVVSPEGPGDGFEDSTTP